MSFYKESEMKKVLACKNHVIMNKRIDVKRALTKEQAREKLLDEKSRKIFIKKLPVEFTKGKN